MGQYNPPVGLNSTGAFGDKDSQMEQRVSQLETLLISELRKISQALSTPSDMTLLNEISRLPDTKLSAGSGTTIVPVVAMTAALATALGLVGGRGVYAYQNATWQKLTN